MCREAKRIPRISTGWHTAMRVSESTPAVIGREVHIVVVDCNTGLAIYTLGR